MENILETIVLGLYRDNGTENGDDYILFYTGDNRINEKY